MNLDTKCIPLAHLQTYMNLTVSIPENVDTVERRSGIRMTGFNSKLNKILNLNQFEMYQKEGIDTSSQGIDGHFVSARQVLCLVDEVIKHLDLPFLGLLMGSLMTLTYHGMAGLAVVTQPTMLKSAKMLERLFSELFPPLEMTTHLNKKEIRIQIDENVPLNPYTHFFIELNFVSFYNIYADLVGHDSDMMPERVEFSYSEPAWGHIYRRYFRCPVVFNAGRNAFVAPSCVANKDMPLANRLMALTAERALFENMPTRGMQLVPLRLRRLFIKAYGAFPSLEVAARELGMSGRTLRRRLAEEETSYQQELDLVRKRFAIEYFLRGGKSLTELSHLLGYSSTSVFTRAFRIWTGCSPTEYINKNFKKQS